MKKNKLNILYEDKYLIAVYKKNNLPTIKCDNRNDNLYSEVFDYLHKKNQKVFVIHRLDKDTCGIVLFAKDEKVKEILQNKWEETTRNYIALVHGKIKNHGEIKSYLKETKTLLSYSTNDKSGKFAHTIYDNIKSNNQYSLIKINIKTGRKNQIRVHMKDNNTPILGDRKYGKKDGYRNMMLFANELSFIHPITSQVINIKMDIPNEYLKVINNN